MRFLQILQKIVVYDGVSRWSCKKNYKGAKIGLIRKMAKMKKNHVFNYRSYNDKIECLIRFATVQCK